MEMSFLRFVELKQQLAATAVTCWLMIVIMLSYGAMIKSTHAADTPVLSGQNVFNVSNDGNKHEVLIANASSYTGTPILRSNDGAYAWQFVPYQNNKSRLLTVLSTAYNTTVIWIANRDYPVSPNASLLVQFPSRTLLLRDGNGSIAWSPPVTDVSSILMNSTGNLIMYNTQKAVVWQSFDYASDVMVPGQIVRTNHSVISRASLEDVSEGNYTLRAEPGGAVLYASFDWQQHMVPYVVLAYAGQQTQVFNSSQYKLALHSECNHTDVLYRADGLGVDLQQEGSIITAECSEEVAKMGDGQHSIDFATRLGGVGFRYMRLMPYGDIVSFLSTNTSVDTVDNQFIVGKFLTFCRLPSFCGINSLCSSQQNCSCPSMFKPVDPSGSNSLGCQLIEPLNCSIASQHQFLAISGVDYYANAYLAPRTVKSPEECQSLCRANCSCTTAFYHNGSGACHLYDQAQTMLAGSDPSLTVYLRVAKLPETGISKGSRISRKVIIGVTCSIAVMVVVFALFVVWIGRRVMRKAHDESDSEEEAFLESLPGLPPRFTYKELHSATEGFSKKLGTGGSGAVFEGRVPHIRDSKQLARNTNAPQDSLRRVAVKELQLSKFSTIAASGKKQFRAEVATLGSLSHVNLVQLRGFCAEGAHRLLIYEFLENGSLDRWIFNSDIPLQWEVRYHIAIDTARGLAFLHEGSRDKVVHLDVKPQNILLDANFRAKLADFGLSKLVGRGAERGRGSSENQTVTAMRGTPGYMAPEWFLNMPVTDKSDVFSYGMVLLELVGGRKNLNLAVGSEEEWYFPAWAVRQAESGNLLDVIDKQLTQHAEDQPTSAVATPAMCTAMSRLLNVAFWCIQESAGSRPSMTTVLLMLEEHLQVPDPPLDRTYILRRQSRPTQALLSTSTISTTSSTSARASTPVSGINSELEPR